MFNLTDVSKLGGGGGICVYLLRYISKNKNYGASSRNQYWIILTVFTF